MQKHSHLERQIIVCQQEGFPSVEDVPAQFTVSTILKICYLCPARAFTKTIAHLSRPQPQQRHNATQIEDTLLVFCQFIERTAAHQAEIGMVVHNFHPKCPLQAVEHSRRGALEVAIHLTALTHAIHYVAPLAIVAEHLLKASDIVLDRKSVV